MTRLHHDVSTMPAAIAASIATAFLLACAAPAAGSADYQETFNDASTTGWDDSGPSNLIAEGWIFRRQTEPEGTAPAWYSDEWDPQEGGQNLRSSSAVLEGTDAHYEHQQLGDPARHPGAGRR